MRVALVTPEWPGCGSSHGVGAYVAVLARALRGAGCTVLTLVVDDSGRWLIDEAGVRRAGAQGGPAALRPLLAHGWLRSELASFAPEVVECSNWGGLGGGLAGPWRRAVRLSTPVSAIAPPDLWRRLARGLHRHAEQATVGQAHLVIADSAAMAALCHTAYGRGADAVIPHAWDGPQQEPDPGARDVLFVGRLEPRKGIATLLQAWARIRQAHPQRVLHLVGADQHGHGAACLAEHGGGGVVVHGPVAENALAGIRRLCLVQAVPSRFESFGMVVLEAWAAGLAVVATAGGALAEVVGTGGTVVPVGDAPALAAALHANLSDAGLRADAVAQGRKLLAGRFSPRQLAAQTLAAYGRPTATGGP